MELLSKLKQEQRKHVYPVSFSCMYGKNEPTKGQSETIRYQVREEFPGMVENRGRRQAEDLRI